MEIREKLMADVKDAMRSKETLKLNALRFLQAAIKNREIELRPDPITSDEVMGVLRKSVKQRKESIEQYQAAGRQDLVDQEAAELKILEAYMPKQMDRAQLEKIVVEVIAKLGAKTPKEMGAVMKEVIAKAAGTADNKMVSEVVKAKLTPA
ncbi:MAG: GatB/YqeY domain-containing protein [Bdellovibrionota bacterium]